MFMNCMSLGKIMLDLLFDRLFGSLAKAPNNMAWHGMAYHSMAVLYLGV